MKALSLCRLGAVSAILLSLSAAAHASVLGQRTDANFLGFTPGDPNTASAVWDTFPSFTFANDTPDSSSNIANPTLTQTGALLVTAQGAGLYNQYTSGPAPAGQPGDMFFAGGNNVSFALQGSVSFTLRGMVLQIKRPGNQGTLADANGFSPTLIVNGVTLSPDNNSFAAGTGDPNVDLNPFGTNYAVTSWFWNTSLTSLPDLGTATFEVDFGRSPSNRGIDFIALDAANVASPVPEPATAGLLLFGLAVAVSRRRRAA